MKLRGHRHTAGRSVPGFVFVELLLVIFVLGILVALMSPVAGKWMRRSEDLAACSAVRQVLAVARLESVKRSANVVVEIGRTPDGRIRLRTFLDRANDETSPLPADEAAAAGNGVQDAGSFASSPATDEPTLAEVSLSSRIRFWKHGSAVDDVAEAVHFDTYRGDAALVDRILFLPSGGIVPPQDGDSDTPTSSGGRGVYFADWQGRNFFRVSVESELSGKGHLDKYVEGRGYVPEGWTWQ